MEHDTYRSKDCRLHLPALCVLILLLCIPAALAVDCASGCSCMSPGDAKQGGYELCGGKQQVCGYDQNKNELYCYAKGTLVVAPVVTKIPMTVITTVPPSCPTGCECLSDTELATKKGTYTRCSDTPCSQTTTVAAAPVTKYCYRQSFATCPSECQCLSEAEGSNLPRCSDNPCGIDTSRVTALFYKYCYRQPVTIECAGGCQCLSEAEGSNYPRCSDTPCYTVTLGASQVRYYCYQVPAALPVKATCPQGCECMLPEDGKAKGLEYCGGIQTVCGAQAVTTTANVPATQKQLYCFGKPSQPVCPSGCDCLTLAEAKEKLGDYKLCTEKPCDYVQQAAATTANAASVPKYCVQKITAEPACAKGCTCLPKEEGTKLGYPYCRGTATVCRYENNVPLYCFEQVPNPACVYDYQKNTCTGTCQQGYSCGLIASSKDQSGKVEYAVCDCTGPPSTPCAYDKEKNTCTGTCKDGSGCAIIGKKVDAATGAADIVCGCPEPTVCTFDYSKDACAGTCTATGDICQLNTIYRDPSTGKTTYAECHCKGAVTATVTTTTYALPCGSDTVSGGCIGACPAGTTCGSYECGIDNTGRKVCTNCRCLGCEFDKTIGSCRGYCPEEGTTCECTGYTTDTAGKLVCTSGCSCRAMCRQDAAGGCSGECPGSGTCTITSYITGKDGAPSPVCGCGAAGATPAAKPTGQGVDVFKSIGDFFKNLFGWK